MVNVLLPKHGKIDCSLCFPDDKNLIQKSLWKIRNDPGAWGAQNPRILVLGFSKGATQTNIYEQGEFDQIAFGGKQSRKNLTKILQRVDLLKPDETVDEKIIAGETEFGFGSLIRCSVAYYDSRSDSYKTSGSIINKSFNEIPEVIGNCTRKFLMVLPENTRLVIMLGTSDSYIRLCRETIMKFCKNPVHDLNQIAYGDKNTAWVHLTHPSPANGWLKNWLLGPANSSIGEKRELARKIIYECGVSRI